MKCKNCDDEFNPEINRVLKERLAQDLNCHVDDYCTKCLKDISEGDYCKIASEIFNRYYVCGQKCPIYKNCPKLIMEDANLEVSEIQDKATDKALRAMLKAVRNGRTNRNTGR